MPTRSLRLLLAFAVLGFAASAEEKKKPAKAERKGADAHMKEELGVNQFTTPGIELILRGLRDLRPIPYDAGSRDMPDATPPNRAQLALSTGGVIADGFLAVVAEKQSRVEIAGRALLKHAKGLGVGDHVTKHARSIIERAATKDWDGVESELIGAQRDVEQGMMDLRDEEVAHLVALGGWLRGLEITATIVAGAYSAERAALLVQPDMVDYFTDRVSTLNPALKKRPLFMTIDANLREVRKVTVKKDASPLTVEDVKHLRELAKTTNESIRKVAE
jgi:hypothetical protein